MVEKLILPDGFKDERSRKHCWACHSPLHTKQKYCTVCNHWQNSRRHFNFSSTILSLLVALVSVSAPLFAQLTRLYDPFRIDGTLSATPASVSSLTNETLSRLTLINQSKNSAIFLGKLTCVHEADVYKEDEELKFHHYITYVDIDIKSSWKIDEFETYDFSFNYADFRPIDRFLFNDYIRGWTPPLSLTGDFLSNKNTWSIGCFTQVAYNGNIVSVPISVDYSVFKSIGPKIIKISNDLLK